MLLTNIDFPTHFRKTKWSNTHNFANQNSSNRKCQLLHLNNYHQYDRVSQLFSITSPDLSNYTFFIHQTNHIKSCISGEQSEQKISKIGLVRDRTRDFKMNRNVKKIEPPQSLICIDNSTFACMSSSYIFNQKLTVNVGRRALEILITLGVLLAFFAAMFRFNW